VRRGGATSAAVPVGESAAVPPCALGHRASARRETPWDSAATLATLSLTRVRLHDLRHTYASFGAGGGLGLPIIGRLLGHAQAATTARYAHLDNDPLRRASEAIATRIAAALDGKKTIPIRLFRDAG
jgi:integrase